MIQNVRSKINVNIGINSRLFVENLPNISQILQTGFEWYMRIADTELSEANLEEFMKDFIPSGEVSNHFDPPKLPNSIWNRIKSQSPNSDEFIKQRCILKSQKFSIQCSNASALCFGIIEIF